MDPIHGAWPWDGGGEPVSAAVVSNPNREWKSLLDQRLQSSSQAHREPGIPAVAGRLDSLEPEPHGFTIHWTR